MKEPKRVQPLFIEPYNPLAKGNLGVSVMDALLARPVEALPPATRFAGAGIYALYYVGDYPAYKNVAEANRKKRWRAPIYIGKAVPKGSRKGGVNPDPMGTSLYHRLRQHAGSIAQVSNLSLNDFGCRFLVVDDIWIPLGENLIIEQFKPLWNRFVEGFGNHTPGKGRFAGQRSAWDTLHPGRPWAEKCKPYAETSQQILARVAASIESPVDEDEHES